MCLTIQYRFASLHFSTKTRKETCSEREYLDRYGGPTIGLVLTDALDQICWKHSGLKYEYLTTFCPRCSEKEDEKETKKRGNNEKEKSGGNDKMKFKGPGGSEILS